MTHRVRGGWSEGHMWMQSNVREDAHEQMPSLHYKIATHLSPLPQLLSVSSPSDLGHAGPLFNCLPLGIMVGFTWRDDSVVFILVQSLDQ